MRPPPARRSEIAMIVDVAANVNLRIPEGDGVYPHGRYEGQIVGSYGTLDEEGKIGVPRHLAYEAYVGYVPGIDLVNSSVDEDDECEAMVDAQAELTAKAQKAEARAHGEFLATPKKRGRPKAQKTGDEENGKTPEESKAE